MIHRLASDVTRDLCSAVSWILLAWHDVWVHVAGRFLGNSTTWIAAILTVVITVRLALVPMLIKSTRSQRAYAELQPKIKKIKDQYKDDDAKFWKERNDLIRRNNANPLFGCLPILLQVPLFLALHRIITNLTTVHATLTQKRLYGWSPSEFDSAAQAKVFGAPLATTLSSTHKTLIQLGADPLRANSVCAILIFFFAASTFMNGYLIVARMPLPETANERASELLIRYALPIGSLTFGYNLPVGVLIYFLAMNIFTITQQYYVGELYAEILLMDFSP